jgi:hypothetical protein
MRLGFVTADELAAAMVAAGKRIAVATVRYHCRDRRGMLWGHAQRVNRVWMIPTDAAGDFAKEWTPYGSLRRS